MTSLEEQVAKVTQDLASSQGDDQVDLLMKRAGLFQQLGRVREARDDVQQVLKRDAEHAGAKALLVSLVADASYTSKSSKKSDESSNKTTMDEEKPKAESDRATALRERLAQWQKEPLTSASIRAFVRSSEFPLALELAGHPDSAQQERAVAYMVLTAVFHPPKQENTKTEDVYPLTLVMEQCARCFGQCLGTGKNKDKQLAYRTLNAVFQINATLGAALFCQDELVADMMDVVEFEIQAVQEEILQVIAVAATDASCRKKIMQFCLPWLTKTAKAADPALKTLATITLTKLQAQPASQKQQQGQGQAQGQGQEEDDVDVLADAMARAKLHQDDMVEQLIGHILSDDDKAMHQHAVEGLAYASLTPQVRVTLASHASFVKHLTKLSLQADASNALLYGIGTIIAHITMYKPRLSEQQKQMQRLRQLANAKNKQKTDENDDMLLSDEAVEARIGQVIDQGAALALMTLVKSKSRNNCTVASQAYLNLVTPQATRGKLLQQGIVKPLVILSVAQDHDGHAKAAQALARLAITTDPRLAFQPQQQLDMVRPFLDLCKDDDQPLGQFEALMALTNLASMEQDHVRHKIDDLDGLTLFETLQLGNNTMIQRAASEMICNMTMFPPVFDRYAQPSKANAQRIRLWLLLSDHDDMPTRRAASGTLAILSQDPDVAKMICEVDRAYERLAHLVADDSPEVQHRVIEIIRQIINHNIQGAMDGLVHENVPQALVAIVKDQAASQVVRSSAMETLKTLGKHGAKIPA
ncbi:armadillo-type protein, partial [Gongronella butleri]